MGFLKEKGGKGAPGAVSEGVVEMSVEDAINYSPSEEEDYYALLSCDESSTVRFSTSYSKRIFYCAHKLKSVCMD